jgi:hypothetical protein
MAGAAEVPPARFAQIAGRRVFSIGAPGTTDTTGVSGPVSGGDVPTTPRTAHREPRP